LVSSDRNHTVAVLVNGLSFYTLTRTLPYKGILVVWCGHLQQNQSFQGIILNLYGDGSAFGSTNCAGNGDLGTYRNGLPNDSGRVCPCRVYAEGGTATRAGMHLNGGSDIFFLPSGDWSFLNGLFENPPPTSFEPRG
jgi:hypothetical protein